MTLKGSEQVAPYLPDTQRLTRSTFWEFIKKYDQVILKPVHGNGGKGVMKKQTYYYAKRKTGSSVFGSTPDSPGHGSRVWIIETNHYPAMSHFRLGI